MAKFKTTGLEDVERAFLMRAAGASASVDKMLKAGADVLVKAQQNEVKATFASDRATGALAASIQASRVKGNDSERYVEVAPTGTDAHGVSNATKGFVLQYGRSNMPARPWMSAANEKAGDAVNLAMREAWEAEQID